MTLLEIRDLRVTFPTHDGQVQAVRGLDLSIEDGEVVGVVGESGSGKSVTMLAIMGLLPKTTRIEGSVTFRGTEILGLKERDAQPYRGAKIAMIFQDPMTSLNPVHTIGAQIAEAMRAHQDVSKQVAANRAVELLELVGIPNPNERARQYPHEYSGGMRQRAMIAMAIVNNPELLIADEPTTALDVTIQAQVLETLLKVREEFGTALALITHDLGVVARMAERVVVMYAGVPVEAAMADELYSSPRHPYTLGLLRSLPRVDERVQHRLTPIPGAPPSLLHPPRGCPFNPRCFMARDECRTQSTSLQAIDNADRRSACLFARELESEVIHP